ncbi:fluoride efflux transporter CrcB [Lachnospiraceae bacterium 46-61]
MIQCLMVALGGGMGAVFRYLLTKIQLPFETTFPIITLFTNFAGAFLIGIVVSVAAKYGLSEKMTLFLKTGLCGGFTTFSTFSLESITLIEQKNNGIAYCYIICSIVFCMIGVWLGKKIF